MTDRMKWLLFGLPVLLLFAAAFWFFREPDPETLSGRGAAALTAPQAHQATSASVPAAPTPPAAAPASLPAPAAPLPPAPTPSLPPAPAGPALPPDTPSMTSPAAPGSARPGPEPGSFGADWGGKSGALRDPEREERWRRRDEERARAREDRARRRAEAEGRDPYGTPPTGADGTRVRVGR